MDNTSNIIQLYTDGNISISRVCSERKRFLPLLLLGDEQESMIDRYICRGEMFILQEDGLKAVSVVTDEGNGVCELKNIAVVPHARLMGYGRKMVEFLMRHYSDAFGRMIVGTGEVPSTLSFYKSCGFSYSHRIRNFFTENYDHIIEEDGIVLDDMVYLQCRLAE